MMSVWCPPALRQNSESAPSTPAPPTTASTPRAAAASPANATVAKPVAAAASPTSATTAKPVPANSPASGAPTDAVANERLEAARAKVAANQLDGALADLRQILADFPGTAAAIGVLAKEFVLIPLAMVALIDAWTIVTRSLASSWRSVPT